MKSVIACLNKALFRRLWMLVQQFAFPLGDAAALATQALSRASKGR